MPSGVKSFEELMQQALPALMGGAQVGAGNDVDSDSDGLTDTEELQWGTDKHNPDTDGDGYTDKQEVDGGYNPLGEGQLSVMPN